MTLPAAVPARVGVMLMRTLRMQMDDHENGQEQHCVRRIQDLPQIRASSMQHHLRLQATQENTKTPNAAALSIATPAINDGVPGMSAIDDA